MKVAAASLFLAWLSAVEGAVDAFGATDLAFGGKCTTIAVSKGASKDGPMVTHTSDCADCDFRVNKMSAAEHAEGSKRTLYVYRGQYPATVTDERSTDADGTYGTWDTSNLEGTEEQKKEWSKGSVVTGSMEQAASTYALIEGGYGMINEHQLIIGESTCASKLWAAPTSAGGKAAFEIRELSRLALERTKTAREAIAYMGAVAEKLGFYSADWSGGDASRGEGGENLSVGDTEEAWMFHIIPDDTGTSAVWVAKKVPDGEVSAVANQFIIRDVDPADRGKSILYSDNIHAVAERMGWYDKEDGLLDFTAVYAPPRAHAPYATRRVWRVFNLVAPSLKLPVDTDPLANDYPFSVKPDAPVGPRDLMAINRDHYDNTNLDLTSGLAAGPYGDPNRFDPAAVNGMVMAEVLNGSFERPISMFRTSTHIVAEARGHLPAAIGARVWLGVYNPASSSYIPLYPSAAGRLPTSYTRGSLFKYDEEVAFWNFCSVGNYAARFYRYAMQDVIAVRDALEELAFSSAAAAEATALGMLQNDQGAEAMQVLAASTQTLAGAITASWRSLLPDLFTKYHDGYHAQSLGAESIAMTKLFYTKAWLTAVGYFDSPPNVVPGMIWFAPPPTASASGLAWNGGVLLLGCLLGAYVALKSSKSLDRRQGYSQIDMSNI
jgi:dipeptidase